MTQKEQERLVGLAREIATRAHQGQTRRDGVRPYIEHPADVASRVKTPDEKMVAWLHDVLEDTDVTATDLRRQGIPEHVVVALEAMTKPKGMDYDGYMNDYLPTVKANELAARVKYHDIQSNMADSPTPKQIAKYALALTVLR